MKRTITKNYITKLNDIQYKYRLDKVKKVHTLTSIPTLKCGHTVVTYCLYSFHALYGKKPYSPLVQQFSFNSFFFFYIFDHTYISHLDYGAVYEHELDILNICWHWTIIAEWEVAALNIFTYFCTGQHNLIRPYHTSHLSLQEHVACILAWQ